MWISRDCSSFFNKKLVVLAYVSACLSSYFSVEKYMPPDKRNFLGFCLYNLFAFFNANGMAFSHLEYAAQCQLIWWQSDYLQVEAKGHLPTVLKCSEMCPEIRNIPLSSSKSSSLNSSPSTALRKFLLHIFVLFIVCPQYMVFHMKHVLLLIGWSALFSL